MSGSAKTGYNHLDPTTTIIKDRNEVPFLTTLCVLFYKQLFMSLLSSYQRLCNISRPLHLTYLSLKPNTFHYVLYTIHFEEENDRYLLGRAYICTIAAHIAGPRLLSAAWSRKEITTPRLKNFETFPHGIIIFMPCCLILTEYQQATDAKFTYLKQKSKSKARKQSVFLGK